MRRILLVPLRLIGSALRAILVAALAVSMIAGGIAFADYAATQGSGTTFASIVIATKHYMAMALCDATVGETQCAAVNSSGQVATTSAQSGTWTIQPGNTPNTSAWLVTGTGGTFPVTGTFWPYTLGQQLAAASVPVVLTAAQLTTLTPPTTVTANLGTIAGVATAALQPTNAAQASTTSGQTGLLVQCAVTTGAPTYTTAQTDPLSCDTSGNLRVSASLAWANTNKTIVWDGTTNITVKAVSTAAAQTDTALVARNPDLGTIGDTAWTTGNGTAIAVLKAIANAAAGSVAAGANLIGYTSGDPCTQKTKKSVAFSTGTTGTQLFAGTASTNTYICSVSVIASAAANFSIVVGSGSSVCTGGTPLALIGSTTAANGMALPANGGLTLGNGGATVVNDVAAAAQAYNVCIGINGTATLAGSISYVQQ